MARNSRNGWSSITSCMAGCFDCGGDAKWFGKNALAVAARHYDATGHHVWVEQVMATRYGYRDDDAPAKATTNA